MTMVSQLMTVAPATLHPRASVREAFAVLDELDIRHVPIVGDNDELVGILSDRDLRALRVGLNGTPEQEFNLASKLDAPVSGFMTRGVVSVSTRDDVGAAIEALLEHRVGALPVVDPDSGDIAGMLSYVDVLKFVRDQGPI